MIEPTETESKETLDAFAGTMLQIAREAEADPDKVKHAPFQTPVGRLDEALANRRPDVRFGSTPRTGGIPNSPSTPGGAAGAVVRG